MQRNMNAISNINLNGIISKLKDHAEQFRGTELEKKVKEATSNANWGVTFQIKEDIARATYDYQSYNQVMSIIWKRMGESGKNWKMVFKSLDLLEYLLKRGSERVIAETQGRQYQIRTLRDFHFSESDGRDKGGGIREKSRSICEVLNDKAALDAERAKARSQVGKYMGISHYDSFGSSFNTHRTSAQFDPDYGFPEHGRNDADASVTASSKKKKKKKKTAPKPEDDLSDDVLSSESESRRPSRVEYHIPEPNAPERSKKKKKKKKKDKARSQTEEAATTEGSLIPDLFGDAFGSSNTTPQPSISNATADPLQSFDFSVASSVPAQASSPSPAFGGLFPESQQGPMFPPSSMNTGPPANDPFQNLLQTPGPSTSSISYQHQPSFTPAPLFSPPQQQQSLFSPSAFPAQNPNFGSPQATSFASFPQQHSESDNDDWGFVSANPTPKPQTQIDFFNTPAKPAQPPNPVIWDSFSTLSLSSPPQPDQQRAQQRVSPQLDTAFAGFDFSAAPSPPAANPQNDLASFF